MTPRYLIEFTCGIGVPSIDNVIGGGWRFLENRTSLVLAALSLRCD